MMEFYEGSKVEEDWRDSAEEGEFSESSCKAEENNKEANMTLVAGYAAKYEGLPPEKMLELAKMMGEYSKHYGYTPGVVTGKPDYLHGSLGREAATGLGVTIITEEVLALHNEMISGNSFVIQGFGNVGYFAAKCIFERGGTILAVSDVSGGISNKAGLDIPKLKEYVNKNGTVQGYPEGEPISNEELLTLKCDVLIPAALGEIFDRKAAENVECRYLIEAANGPTEPDGDEVFNKRGIIVVPDILTNAGGVVVSYFEWVQNIQQYSWTLERVNEELYKFMTMAFQRVVSMAKKRNCTLRTAAYILGLGRVAKARTTLGL